MATYAPTTELEAVNVMLSVIGEAPVSSLDISGFSDVAAARQLLNEVSREIQSEQWECNTEDNYTLVPDSNGYINIPSNLLKADIDNSYSYKYQPVRRGDKFYDKLNHTFTFTESIPCSVVWFLPFTDLPETLRRYITVAAARKYQKRFYNSETLDNFTKEDEYFARANALADDTFVADYNMTQNYGVMDILLR